MSPFVVLVMTSVLSGRSAMLQTSVQRDRDLVFSPHKDVQCGHISVVLEQPGLVVVKWGGSTS